MLGIETSCDETSVAVVENGRTVLSNIVFSQMEMHRKTGGVVPEVAAREHALKMIPVLEEALKKAKIKLSDLDAIAVTQGPGLSTSLLVGTNCANTLALLLKKPLVPVNHIEGHMYANFLTEKLPQPKFPIVVLTASGGHNELILWHDHGRYTFLGSTLDDAAGEAFDKVARMLGLPYPGGPQIEKLAREARPEDMAKIHLPLPYPKTFDFSFSGMKTAVLYLVRDLTKNGARKLTKRERAAIAAQFQDAVCEVMARKLLLAAEKFQVREIHLAGGVSANGYLRKKVHEKFMNSETGKVGEKELPLRYPPLSLCTDNAAMIAAAGYFKYTKNPLSYQRWKPVISNPRLSIKSR